MTMAASQDVTDAGIDAFWGLYAQEAYQADRRMIARWNRALDIRLLFVCDHASLCSEA